MADRMNGEAMIEGRGIEKVFKDFWGRPKARALRGVDVTVPRGAVFGLLGPNGAGKSTLIKIILGHLYCSAGRMRVLGKNPRDVGVKRHIGYLPERTAFYTNLNALETLALFGKLLGLSSHETRRRSDQLLSMVGLENATDRLVGEFSHGMRKRLGLAQSLLNDPDLLLLDEPTAGLDPIGCHEIKELIMTLGRRGKTVLMTSHLLGDVQDVCDTIMILYGGQVRETGKVSELLAKTDELNLRSPLVSEKVLRSVKATLAEEVPPESIDVSYPTRSLEDYFVSVVANANRDKAETSGAASGKGVADYLKTIDSTTSAPPPKTLNEQPAPPPSKPTPLPDDVASPKESPTKSQSPPRPEEEINEERNQPNASDVRQINKFRQRNPLKTELTEETPKNQPTPPVPETKKREPSPPPSHGVKPKRKQIETPSRPQPAPQKSAVAAADLDMLGDRPIPTPRTNDIDKAALDALTRKRG